MSLGEAMHNYPEGYKEGPYCPYTKLVQISASLAGIELTPETFCTETLKNARFSDGAIHWLKQGDFYPRVSCVKVNQELVQQLKIVEKVVEAPSDKDTTEKIAEAKDLSAKREIFKSYEMSMEKYERRQSIIDRWRKIIFETSVSTTSDEKNPHFRQFKSADELSEEEIVGRVKQFTQALSEITGLQQEWHIPDGAENCPQSPKHNHYGPYT